MLVLRAFASGSTAMTGIEAISNAVPSFKPVEWRNARITLTWMVALLIGMFAGVLAISRLAGVVPVASQTMLSQLAHLSFGSGPMYIFIQASTAAVLLMAANTSYNDFPRVLFLMARDRQAPRSFLHIGDRLTFRNGIVLLSVSAAAIYIGFRGNTETLLPLYAVGVFLAFTLSQSRDDHALAAASRTAALAPQPGLQRHRGGDVGIVFVIEGITKFTEGAWVSIVLISGIITIALRIHRYYQLAAQQLALRPEEATAPAACPARIAPRRTGDPRARGQGAWTVSEAGTAEPRADRRAHHRPGYRHGPGRDARAGIRRSTQPACVRAARQPDRRRRPTGSSATGRHGETTCPSRSSSPRTAPRRDPVAAPGRRRPFTRHQNGGTLEHDSHHRTQADTCSIKQTSRKITRLTGGQPQS